ncbi:UBX domain-containing protein 4 [Daldinia childiae]|uniref:UBX domain-containing protein 4 n=1 Tax=Daldinia childiae TaxID=326645 RepID=UPI001448364F|nr:UBX domain-containing protein 4 [Daldinia childiae]KAF3063635.1 UBX domain-containing protein 4 [Daldinia childiae]
MSESVFFQGSLQDGISLAIHQSKMVLAFVTDSGDESQLWENELLANDSLKAPLKNQAVALRLQAGSEEAGFLEALFPIPKKPTVVIIQNGTLKEYIQGGTAKEDLVRRIEAILSTATVTQTQQTATAPARQASSQPPPAAQAPVSTSSNVLDDLYDDYDIPARPSPVPAESSREGQSSQEAKRLEAEKKAKEAKEAKAKETKAKAEQEAKAKAEREAQAQERRRASESNEGQSSTTNRPERSYAEEVRQQKIRATEDRKRILKRIEDDKRERREREAKERQARLLLNATNDTEASSSQTPAIPLARRQASSSGDHCNLQVRLFDGSTIRSRFKSDATLNKEVRKWIDEDRTDGDAPYTFRIVLTPLPNKAVEPAEETESLLSLGLAPSATLVLVHAKYSSAFARASDGLIWRSLAYVLGFFGSGYGFLVGMLGGLAGLLSSRGAASPEEVPLQNLAEDRIASGIRGFYEAEDRRRDAQLYNGNSLNFEPRRDEDDEDVE